MALNILNLEEYIYISSNVWLDLLSFTFPELFDHGNSFDFLKYVINPFFVGNQPDHQYFLYGESREKGNVMVVNDKGYLGPICDENWDIEEVKQKIQ